MLISEKKKLLDKIYYYFGRQNYDFDLMILQLDDEKKVVSSKWVSYKNLFFQNPQIEYSKDFFSQVNNRTILPCEVVIDIESGEKFQEIIKLLVKKKFFFYPYNTGSRGFHIHLFFNRALNRKEKVKFLKKYGLGIADLQKAGERCPIALENCEHYKTGNKKTPLIVFDETAFLSDINYLPIDCEGELNKDNLKISDDDKNKIHKEAEKFREQKINEMRAKATLTASEKEMLKIFIEKNNFIYK